MMTVALVATLAATALWQQWRGVEIESRERERLQAGWILIGALDWARLILREDARSGGADHLAEPWSIALEEARLSTFLAMDSENTAFADNAFLSGQITDAQARLNVANLVVGNKVSEPDLQAFERLFESLGVDPTELERMVANLLLAVDSATPTDNTRSVPILPQRVAQLRWLGVSADALRRIAPFVVILPTRTPVNLNTAPAEVIAARIPGVDLAQAASLVSARARAPFRTLADAQRALAASVPALNASEVGVASHFFEVRGRLRLRETLVLERSLVQRNGMAVTTVWRAHGARSGQFGAVGSMNARSARSAEPRQANPRRRTQCKAYPLTLQRLTTIPR